MPTFTITSVEDGQGELKVHGNMATSCAEGDFLATEPLSRPGTDFAYNNLASWILGRLVTRHTGRTVVDLVDQHVLAFQQAQERHALDFQRQPGQQGGPSRPMQRPSGAMPRPGQQAPRPSGPVQRPSAPIQRPPAVPPQPQAPSAGASSTGAPSTGAPSTGGRHSLPEPDAMHHPEASPQAERVSRARRHRLDED